MEISFLPYVVLFISYVRGQNHFQNMLLKIRNISIIHVHHEQYLPSIFPCYIYVSPKGFISHPILHQVSGVLFSRLKSRYNRLRRCHGRCQARDILALSSLCSTIPPFAGFAICHALLGNSLCSCWLCGGLCCLYLIHNSWTRIWANIQHHCYSLL